MVADFRDISNLAFTTAKPLDSANPCKRARQALPDSKTSPSTGGSNQESSKACTVSSTRLRRCGGHSWCATKTGRSRSEGLGLGLDILQDLNTKGFYTKIGGGEAE